MGYKSIEEQKQAARNTNELLDHLINVPIVGFVVDYAMDKEIQFVYQLPNNGIVVVVC